MNLVQEIIPTVWLNHPIPTAHDLPICGIASFLRPMGGGGVALTRGRGHPTQTLRFGFEKPVIRFDFPIFSIFRY